jgi:hypothetical protein
MLFELMTRCFETPTIIPKIVARCVTQAREKLVVGVSQVQMGVSFSQGEIVVFNP